MKKSLLALAVAGAVAVPYTQAAEVTYSGSVTELLYLGNTETSGGEAETEVKKRGTYVASDGFSLSVNATEDVGFGSAFAHFDLDGGESGSAIKNDNVKVGLTGSFGTVTLGEVGNYSNRGQIGSGDAHDATSAHAGSGGSGNPSTLSYDIPSVVTGLTFGANVITDTYASDDKQNINGTSFGGAYALDFGGSGSLSLGFGSGSRVTQEYDLTNDKLEDGDKTTKGHQSIGLKYSISGFSLGYQTDIVTSETEIAATKVKTETEPANYTGILLGYGAGPVSASVISSSYVGGQVKADDSKEKTGSLTRLDLGYSLSDNVSLALRNQSTTDSVKDAKDSTAAYTRVGITVSF